MLFSACFRLLLIHTYVATVSYIRNVISGVHFRSRDFASNKQKIQGHGFIGYPKGRNVETALGPSCPCVLCISHSLGLYLLHQIS